MPREGSVKIIAVAGNTAYRLTDVGLQQLRDLAQFGTPIKSIAEFFGVSDDWLRKAIDGDPLVREAYQSAKGDGELELRKAAHETALAGDSRVMTFMLERRLKMNKEVEVNVNHTHKVIGAVPDYKMPADKWLERFKPSEQLPAPVDAEFEDVSEAPEKVKVGDDDGEEVDG